MPTIDLSASPSARDRDAVAAAPRRVGLTLAELRHAGRLAGGAPLPCDAAPVPAPPTAAPGSTDLQADPLTSRLGRSPQASDADAFQQALEQLHDPADTLRRRGLLTEGGDLDRGLAGAIGLLATPEVALDIDLTIGVPETVRLKAWHRQQGPAVATLATVDGLVFELAWLGVEDWAAELARVAVLPAEAERSASAVPASVDLPYAVADAVVEALAEHRGDLVETILERDAGTVRLDGRAVPTVEAAAALRAMTTEARGRLRALVARVGPEPERVGVLSWTLLADGWHALRGHRSGDDLRVEVRAVRPDDLPTVLAPTLAEAAR